MKVILENCQRVLPVSSELLRRLAQAGDQALELITSRGLALGGMPAEVSGSLVDDVMIAEVHGQYMDDPTPTDVITFPYGKTGEILISVETAARQAREFGNSWESELALYLVHGILHLCGYEDSDEAGRSRMAELQGGLVEEVFRLDLEED